MSDAKTRRNAASGSSRKLIISTGIVLSLIICVVLLYPALRNYYLAYRVNEQLLQELAAVEERNNQIRGQIAYLNTDEGIADRARERFGWTPEGELAVNITGLEVSDTTTVLPATVPTGSGEIAETWWTALLDTLFAVEEETAAEPLPDPFISE